MEPNLIIKQDLSDNKNTFKFVFIELLLAHPSFIAKFSKIQRNEILSEALNKYMTKKENSEVYSVFNQKTTLLIMHLYVNQEKKDTTSFNNSDIKFDLFEKQIVYPGDSIANLIVDKTKKSLNK
jgi:hypothetical protein